MILSNNTMAKNPNFKRLERITTQKQLDDQALSRKEHDQILAKNYADKIKNEKQKAKELRWATRGTLGELTEKYISQGDSENGAYETARQELGF